MPYYNRDPRRDRIFDNHPRLGRKLESSSGLTVGALMVRIGLRLKGVYMGYYKESIIRVILCRGLNNQNRVLGPIIL